MNILFFILGYLFCGVICLAFLGFDQRLRVLHFQSKQFSGMKRTRFVLGVYVGIVLAWPQLFMTKGGE